MSIEDVVSNAAGPAQSPADLAAALQARNRQVAAVHTITRLLSSTLDLDERIRAILSVSMGVVPAAAGSVLLYRPTDQMLVFQYVVGPKARTLTGYAMPVSDGLAGQVFTRSEPVIANHPHEVAVHRADVGLRLGVPTRSILTVPLRHHEGRPVGVMQLINKEGGDFDAQDLEMLEIVAAIAATAIENAQSHRSAQMEAVAYAVADLSHHIRNKVTPIAVAADTLSHMLDGMMADVIGIRDEACKRLAERLDEATDAVRGFYPESHQITHDQVKEIQDYTKVVADALRGIVAEPQLQPHDLPRLVERQLVLLEPMAQKRGVCLQRDLRPVAKCRLDRAQVESAIYHIVTNAIESTAEGGCVTVSTRACPAGKFPKGSYALIEVSDTGAGMPPQLLHAILRGEARTVKPGRTGLGTRIAYYALRAHEGVLEGTSDEGKGTTFRMKLPLRGMALVAPPGARGAARQG